MGNIPNQEALKRFITIPAATNRALTSVAVRFRRTFLIENSTIGMTTPMINSAQKSRLYVPAVNSRPISSVISSSPNLRESNHLKSRGAASLIFQFDGRLRVLWKTQRLRIDPISTRAIPAASDEIRKNTGSSIEYHKGCRRGDMITNKVPNEDWCMDDKVTPAITNGMVSFLMTARSIFLCRDSPAVQG